MIADLAAVQDGVVSRAQLRRLGVDRFRVRNEVAARRWQTAGSRVVVLHTGAPTYRQRMWIAVLHAGPGAVLAGLSAATAGGLRGWEPGVVHVAVRRGKAVPPMDGVVVHELRRMLPSDVAPGRNPPRHQIDRALIDAAAWLPDADRAGALLASGVQQRLTTADRLLAALERAGQVRHRALLRALLHDIAGGAEAMSEIDFARLCRRAKLPQPVRQVRRRDAQGKWRYLDVTWKLSDGRLLVAEIDGGVHLRPLTYSDDMFRQNELVIGRDVVLRFSSLAVRTQGERVIEQLGRAFDRLVSESVRYGARSA